MATNANTIPYGYPPNPASVPQVNPSVAAGVPAESIKVVQGITVMTSCACGMAVTPDQLGAHRQSHGQSAFDMGGLDYNREVEV